MIYAGCAVTLLIALWLIFDEDEEEESLSLLQTARAIERFEGNVFSELALLGIATVLILYIILTGNMGDRP